MLGLTGSRRAFLIAYGDEYSELKQAAVLAQDIVKAILEGYWVRIDSVTSRAKSLDSTRAKLREKNYEDPVRDLTDAIGVRVITYYKDDVDKVTKRLSEQFTVDRARSVDRRAPLGLHDPMPAKDAKARQRDPLRLRTFGYRSVHLIVRLKGLLEKTPEYEALRSKWFEIQVRTLVGHAWAQVEHEVVYKSGTQYLGETYRRFAAAAATLELLDNEFLRLRDEQNALVDRYRERYKSGRDKKSRFDVARLVAYLEESRPYGPGWRQALKVGAPFPKGLDRTCVQALAKAGLYSARRLDRAMRSARFRRYLELIAVNKGIASATVTHPVIVAAVVAATKPQVLWRHFPEILGDPMLQPFLYGIKGFPQGRSGT